MFNPDTEVLHTPWQWLTGDCCGGHKARIACWRKEVEKGKCFQRFIFLAVQAASPSWRSPLYYISSTNTLFKKVQPKHCSLYPHQCQSFSKVHWGPCCSSVSWIASSQRPQWWTCVSNSKRETWQGKFDRLLSGVPLPRFSSAVNYNLTLDLLPLLRAVVMLFHWPALFRAMSAPTVLPRGTAGIFHHTQMLAVWAWVSTLNLVTNLMFGIWFDSEAIIWSENYCIYGPQGRPYSTLYLGIVPVPAPFPSPFISHFL